MPIKINDLIINALILLHEKKGIRSVSAKTINKYSMKVINYFIERGKEDNLEINSEDWEKIKMSKNMPYAVIEENGRKIVMMKENFAVEDLKEIRKIKGTPSLEEMIAFYNKEALEALGIIKNKDKREPLDEIDFLELFLAILATKTNNESMSNPKAYLKNNYLNIFGIILEYNIDWKDEYSCLLNVKKYTSDIYNFETDFEKALNLYTYNNKERIDFEIYKKQRSIEFDKEKISEIVIKYDVEIIEKMTNFVLLYNNIVFQEEVREEMMSTQNRIIQRYGFSPNQNKQKVKTN